MVRHHVIAAAGTLAALLIGGVIFRTDRVGASPATFNTAPVAERVRTGDLIFRSGRGWRADAVRAASISSWTHVGIVDMDRSGRAFVIHAAPPERGAPGAVLREPLEQFAAATHAEEIEVERLDLPRSAIFDMVVEARRFADRRTPFDDAFDLSSDRAIYCTELIWRSLWNAGVHRPARTRAVPVPLMTGRYMTPDDLRSMLPLTPVLSRTIA